MRISDWSSDVCSSDLYQRKYDRYYEDGVRSGPGLPDSLRTVRENADSWNYEISGDYQFGLGPGKLKLIGLRRFSHEPYNQEIVMTPDGGVADRKSTRLNSSP